VFGTFTEFADQFGAVLAEHLVSQRKALKIQSNDNAQLKESLAAAANSHALEKEALEKRLEQSAADAEKQRGQLQEMLDTKSTELSRMCVLPSIFPERICVRPTTSGDVTRGNMIVS